MGLNIALAGNPNCGKTTMFNRPHRSQPVRGELAWRDGGEEGRQVHRATSAITITDLPGVYSLSPLFARGDCHPRLPAIEGNPDVVVNLVDATNLERNLYLTTQIINLGRAGGDRPEHDGSGGEERRQDQTLPSCPRSWAAPSWRPPPCSGKGMDTLMQHCRRGWPTNTSCRA